MSTFIYSFIQFLFSEFSVIFFFHLFQVLDVTQDQVTRALQTSSSSFDAFRTKVFTLTYNEITKLAEKENQVKKEWEAQVKPVK